MRLFALSDLHVGYEANRNALEAMGSYPDDWLILCGDIGETDHHLDFTFSCLAPKFKQLIWVPGNHELWTHPHDPLQLKGEAKYLRLVELARKHGVLTPEDDFPIFNCEGKKYILAPLFTLYDYSFGPDGLSPEQAIEWALEEDISCADEFYLRPDPFPSKYDWCRSLCLKAEKKLAAVDPSLPIVIVNHFPLRLDLVKIPAIPRFVIWCGTRRTENWHKQFNVEVVVSGHLHLRSTKWRDGVRFEEVSLGYPRQWSRELRADAYLCEILPFSTPSPHPDRYFGLRGRERS